MTLKEACDEIEREAGDKWPTVARSIRAYLERRIPPGHFVRACLAGDLYEAATRADLQNRPHIPAIALALYWNAPSDAIGSYANVQEYLNHPNHDPEEVKP